VENLRLFYGATTDDCLGPKSGTGGGKWGKGHWGGLGRQGFPAKVYGGKRGEIKVLGRRLCTRGL